MDNNKELRKVKVKTISQYIYEFHVPTNITIADFKTIIFEKTQVPIDKQRLIFMGKLVQDSQLLNDISINSSFLTLLVQDDDQTIHLMALSSQPQPQSQQSQQPQQTQQQIPAPQIFQYTLNQSSYEGFTNQIANLIGNIVGQQQQMGSQQQSTSQLSLPNLTKINQLLDSTMGQQSSFPGPSIPQNQSQNQIQNLGKYLQETCFQIQRALPFLQRTADLLIMEPLMNQVEDRVQTERMCQVSANLMKEIDELMKASNTFKNIEMGQQVGSGRVMNVQQNSQEEYQNESQIQTDIQNIIINIDASDDIFAQGDNLLNQFNELTLRDLILQIEDSDEELVEIFKVVKVQDILSSDLAFIDKIKANLKIEMNKQVEKYGNVDKLKKGLELIILNFLLPLERISQNTENELRTVIGQKICEIQELVVLIINSNLLIQNNPNSSPLQFMNLIKQMLAQSMHFIIQEMPQGLKDYEYELKQNLRELFLKCLGFLSDENIINSFWQFAYQSYIQWNNESIQQ